jgi:hypothetical protein
MSSERQPKPKLAQPKPKVEGNTPATKVAKYDPVLDRIPETMHIIAVMWMGIIGYSLLVSYLSRGPWWEMIAHYLGFMTSLYFWHWQVRIHSSLTSFFAFGKKLSLSNLNIPFLGASQTLVDAF